LLSPPPHPPPPPCARGGGREGGRPGHGEWIAVDQGTLATSFPDVYAIGDVTEIPLANKAALPKAGLFAEAEGERVARAIAARVTGAEEPPAFDGHGACFLEMGGGEATLVEGDFFATPAPYVRIADPSAEHLAAKHRFEAERLARWFGG
jgi:sulfide:quinone oxidoreductase